VKEDELYLSNFTNDLRFAARQLRLNPGFTLTAVITLALCIGANAAIFTLVHAVLLRNLPVSDPKTLVRVGDADFCCVMGGLPENDDYAIFSYDLYRHLQDNTPEFEQLAAVQAGFGIGTLTVRSNRPNDLAKPGVSEFVSGNYFQTLGVRPLAGRMMQPADDAPGAAPVAVMSYGAWQRQFGADPSVVGGTFVMNTQLVTIIGIAPEGFYGDRMSETPPDFFVPMNMEPLLAPPGTVPMLHRRGLKWVYLIGRPKPGTNLAALQAKVSGLTRQWVVQLDDYQQVDGAKHLAATHVVITPGGAGIENMQSQYKTGLWLLMGISGLVLLIGCANIANLVLVRGMGRRMEVSIRVALGAQQRRVISQMLIESVLLALLGGVAGLLVAYAGTHTLLSLFFPSSPDLPINAAPSPIILAFGFGISLLTGLLFGIAPAWLTSRANPAEAMRGSNRMTQSGTSPLQKILVVLQATLSLILLVSAGLLSQSLNRLEHQNFGLETQNRVVVHFEPFNAGYKPTELQPLYEQVESRLGRIPGVDRVGLALWAPLDGNNWGEAVFVQGRPQPGPNDRIGAGFLRVSSQFFDSVGEHVLRGRGITPQDTATSPGVAVVNQTFVKRFFPNGDDPIGKHFGTEGIESSADFEIVGVVSDAKYANPRSPARPMYFRPFLQIAKTKPDTDAGSSYASAIVLRLKGPVSGLETQVRQNLAAINPNLTVEKFESFDDQVADRFGQERLIARLTLLFGILALLLASVGLYGVTAYTVARRTSEIGVRMAMGARRGSVIGLVLRGAMLQTASGLAIGIPLAIFCERFVKDQLYDAGAGNSAVLAVAVLTLTLAACVAALIPAQRAASIDPVKALRTE
jgi:predicted permease